MENVFILANKFKVSNVFFSLLDRLLLNIKVGGIALIIHKYNYFYGDKNHPLQAEITVKDQAFFSQIFWRGGLGLAEGFMLGSWITNDLTKVLQVFAANISIVDKVDRSIFGGLLRVSDKIIHLLNSNNLKGSRVNIAQHYDLGNDFFALFLDQSMMYSCAKFYHSDLDLPCDLHRASLHKLDLICQKLKIQTSDHILEIGTGWGGFAIYAAQTYGCQVTTTTISKRQYDYTCDKVTALGLQQQITVLLKDYRELEGKFDKLVSIEMIEAVGHQYFDRYFGQCAKLLKDDGLFLLQAITIPEQRYKFARDSVDFIKQYIFPGGCVPSLGVMLNSINSMTDFSLLDIEDITYDYAKTIDLWRQNFLANYDKILALGFNNSFMRKWLYYFSYCEAGFLERLIQDQQILLAKQGYRDNAKTLA